MKKLIGILVVVAMMAAILVTSVFATEAPKIVVSDAEVAAGEEVTVTVSVDNGPDICNGQVKVVYDETALELVSIDTTTGILAGKLMCMTNGASVAFLHMEDFQANGVLFTVTFKALDTANGDYEVGIEVSELVNNAGEELAFEVVAGNVSVAGVEVHEHTLNHVEAVEPGCHFTGNVEYWYCTECEMVCTDEAMTQVSNRLSVVVPALGGEVVHVEAKEPTCYEEGNIEHWYCEECEKVWQDEALTQLTNHQNVKVAAKHTNLVHVNAVAPGCHYEGNTEYWICYDCEGVWADEALTQVTNVKNVIVPALGGEVDHKEAIAPGCHYDGQIEHWVCYECEQVWQDEALTQLTNIKNIVVPALGGDVMHVEAVGATCVLNGNIEYWYCEECEQVWQDEALTQLTNIKNIVVPAPGHNYVDGVCTVCGENELDVPATGDMSAIVFALVAVSGMGLVALTKKKED